MSEIIFGTTNKGKISEVRALLTKHNPNWTLKDLQNFKNYFQPPENGKTFLENAQIKARSLKALRNSDSATWVLAEDSGLEVEALGALPGLHSARYAGPKASDSENIAKLLKMMTLKMSTTRNARFFCQFVAISPSGEEKIISGEMRGSIATKPAGLLGFGYDPIFVAEGQTQTLAELGPGFKNQFSHRSQAFLEFLKLLV